MKKVLSILLICLLLVGCGGKSDAVKFKEEYESYNTIENDDGEVVDYIKMDIKKDNPMKYVTAKKTVSILKHGTGIIYFGFPMCPWCRNMLPSLLEAATSNDIKTIYYCNPKDIRDTYNVVEGKVTLSKDGTKEYYQLLDILSDYLEDYVITDGDGKTYSTNEKRLYVPYVFFVKDGKIVGYHVNTVSSHTVGTDLLTEEQQIELTNIFNDLIQKIK